MSMLVFEDALNQLLSATRPVAEVESVPLLSARGRVLATAVRSTIDVPPLDNSAMDGYAIRAIDVPVAGTRLPVRQRITAGSIGTPLVPGTAARIFTGAPIPPGADAVVMQEACQADGDHVVVDQVPKSGGNIRRAGEDIAQGAEVLTAGVRLAPQHIGMAASVGLPAVTVYRRLKVALFSTGDELVSPGEPLRPGAIYNSNRFFLNALLTQLGCEVTDLGIIPDKLEQTRAALREAASGHDVILTSGGVSVGEEDHVKPAVQAEGELNLWKVAIKPGKPLAFGRVGKAAFLGLPGNPVSAYVTFLTLVRPVLLKAQGCAVVTPFAHLAEVGFDWPRADARREYLRARIGDDGRLERFHNQGSGVLTSMVWSHGLIDLEPGRTLVKGDRVRFIPFPAFME